jgi:hypothetical protein
MIVDHYLCKKTKGRFISELLTLRFLGSKRQLSIYGLSFHFVKRKKPEKTRISIFFFNTVQKRRLKCFFFLTTFRVFCIGKEISMAGGFDSLFFLEETHF